MANNDLSQNMLGNARVNFPQAANGLPGQPTDAQATKFRNIANMRAALAAAQPATYTSAVLDTMTKNDMVFALRKFENIEYK
jgi:hypothetical protein